MLITCTVAGFFVFACQSPDPTPPAARFCRTMTAPVLYSAQDTAETRRQLRALNAKWRTVCDAPAAGER
ncbi:hypothetical protein OKC48_20590 [Methylorubrum extorquens]|uniref:hypothetical protein n=1 Tax=Methylorubrum extorquens TaxID=408 RepID=UPI00223701D8|nr:hypothetical protein [Methylorubrum extorquens]UYW25646.1 hypothetical protein OKC48_20590 [Methylorubrum extorquens]